MERDGAYLTGAMRDYDAGFELVLPFVLFARRGGVEATGTNACDERGLTH